jgi:3-isopropylmalate dehydrogenase
MKIALLPGDDIGPEISAAVRQVLEDVDSRFSLALDIDEHTVGMAAHRRLGTTLPDSAMQACLNSDGVILGPGGMTEYPPVADGGVNIPGAIRKRLDLYANIRPSKYRPGIPKALPDLDVVIVRENTQGFYADRNLFEGYGEFRPTADSAMSMRLITRSASERIARVAFEQARERRGLVTIVGKRHVLQITDGLFVSAVNDVAEEYPEVTVREIDVDAMAADLYLRPGTFDVILTSNMYGDILSNEASAFAGGLGLASALNVGDHFAAANAGHGSAPDIAGQGIANPTSLILSSALLLDWYGRRVGSGAFRNAAKQIQVAVDTVLAKSSLLTRDLGGTASTAQFAEAVIAAMVNDAALEAH